MLYYLYATVYVFACLFLLIVVLLQQGKGGDIAAAFGGSSSQTAFGARAGATVLTRATTILGALFMIGALALNIVGRGTGSSVVGGIKAPAAAPAAAPAPPLTIPTTPAPQPTTATPAVPKATTPTPATPAKPPIKRGGGGGL